MKRFVPLVTLFLLILLIVGLAAGYFWWKRNAKPVSNDNTQVRFVIPKGRSAVQVADKLYEQELIKSPLAFKFYVQLTGNAEKIQAGEFLLSPNLSLFGIVDQLLKGPVELWVTIPEGLRREEVVERFIEVLEMNSAQAVNFRKEFSDESEGLEGYLFPDTYLFPRDATASVVVAKMKSVFEERVDVKMKEEIIGRGFTLNQIITLASIIERETITEEERPVVSGILLKRFEAGWSLQVDATVQYAVGSEKCRVGSEKCEDWWPILTKEDLEIDSPYNSYKFTGLPPAPIANPGISSIKAAVYPEESPYWFYIHDPEGNIHFAKTLEEHNRNIRKYLGKS